MTKKLQLILALEGYSIKMKLQILSNLEFLVAAK